MGLSPAMVKTLESLQSRIDDTREGLKNKTITPKGAMINLMYINNSLYNFTINNKNKEEETSQLISSLETHTQLQD